MKEASKTSPQMTLQDILSATFSPALPYGQQPSVAPDGPTHERYGPAVVLANLSARQAKAAGLLTSGTYGPRSSTSSKQPSRLEYLYLVSRLRAKTDLLGSTLFTMTWKERATPSGRLISALRASVPRTSASASSSWPTPDTSNVADGTPFDIQMANMIARRERVKEQGQNGSGRSMTLQFAAQATSWPTSTSKEGAGGEYKDPERAMARAMGPHANDLRDFAQMAGRPTPMAHEARLGYQRRDTGKKGTQESLTTVVINGMGSKEHLSAHSPARLTASGELLTGSSAGMESGGRLNPELPLWLMGLPIEWANSAPTETRSSSRSRKRSSKA